MCVCVCVSATWHCAVIRKGLRLHVSIGTVRKNKIVCRVSMRAYNSAARTDPMTGSLFLLQHHLESQKLSPSNNQ